MPNWCTTSYVAVGDRKQVKRLYKMMDTLQKMEEPLVENGFGSSWLGCLVKKLGKDPKKVYCRGDWSNLKWRDETSFSFDTEHAWSRPQEVEELILSKFPDISLYFLEEELGMGIFQTNDSVGEYFKETVIIDSEDEGMEYFTEEEALKEVSELTGAPISDWEQAYDALEKYNSESDEETDDSHGQVWIHRVDYV